MSGKKFVLSFICILVTVTTIHCSEKGRDRQSRKEKGLFGKGRTLVTQGKYQEAIPLLQKYLKKHSAGPNASRAQFFIGKAYIGLGNPDYAGAAFEATIQKYPRTLEAHKSFYKLGMIDFWQGRTDKARRRFAVLAQTPDGPMAPEAAAMYNYLGLANGAVRSR
ncbi:tetratricopeptide repeat protein [Desulfobacterales bacterium HSG2]|nr:tetratricopeptide repeat protein [Desulfobacterales bacterium HSG2]